MLCCVRCEGKSLAEKLAVEQRLAGLDVECGVGWDSNRVKAAQGALAWCDHPGKGTQGKPNCTSVLVLCLCMQLQ